MGVSEELAAVPVRDAGVPQGLTLIVVSMMPILAISSLVPGLPQLLVVFRGMPHHDLLVPMILTVPSVCIALCASLAGMIADKWGRRRLLLSALLAFSVLGMVPLFFDSLLAVLASRVVVGLAEAAILTCANTLWGDYFVDEQRTKWLGIRQIAGPVLNSLLALAGGALAAIDWHFPFFLYGCGLLAFGLVWFLAWEPPRAETGQVMVAPLGFPWKTALAVSAGTLAVSLVFYIAGIQQGRIFAELGAKSPGIIGVLVMVSSVGALAGAFLFTFLRRLPIGRLLALGLAGYGVGYFGISFSPGIAVGTLFSAIAAIGSSIVLPTIIAWALASYRLEHRGRGMGLWGAVFFGGQFLSPPMLNVVTHWSGGFLRAVGAVGLATLVAAGACLWRNRCGNPAMAS